MKIQDWKKRAGYFALISTIAGGTYAGIEHLDERYTIKEDHEKLKVRVVLNELKRIYEEALGNMYMYAKLSKKHPNDVALKRQFEDAKKQVTYLEERIAELEKTKDLQ
jgi:hypothetical protein